jgi:O-antigen/teichoic acid export membrane protein
VTEPFDAPGTSLGDVVVLETAPDDVAWRSTRRVRRLTATGASQAVARGLVMAVALITVPVAIATLGPSQFGVWITISILLSLGGVFDFGIGNGLIREAAIADARGDLAGLRSAVSNAFAGLLGIAVGVLGGGLVLGLVIQPSWLGFAADVDRPDLRWTVIAVASCMALMIPTLAGTRVQQGLQQGYKNALWTGVGACLQLLGVCICGAFDLSLPWFVLAFAGGPALGAVGNGASVFFGSRVELRPDFGLVRWSSIQRLARVGGLFFLLGLVGAISYECDALIIGRRLGASSVAEYSVSYRVFTIVPLGIGLFVAALWPAYGEALERGDTEWIKTAYRRSIRFSLLGNTAAALALVLSAEPLIEAWVGKAVLPDRGLVFALAAFAIVNSWSGPMAMFLNGTGVVGFQVKCALLMMAMNIGLSWILAGSIGTSGPVLATVISQVVCILIPSAVFIHRCLDRMDAR